MSLLMFRSKGVSLELGNLTGGTVNGTNRTGFVGTSPTHTLPTHSRPHTSHALSTHFTRPPSPHTSHSHTGGMTPDSWLYQFSLDFKIQDNISQVDNDTCPVRAFNPSRAMHI